MFFIAAREIGRRLPHPARARHRARLARQQRAGARARESRHSSPPQRVARGRARHLRLRDARSPRARPRAARAHSLRPRIGARAHRARRGGHRGQGRRAPRASGRRIARRRATACTSPPAATSDSAACYAADRLLDTAATLARTLGDRRELATILQWRGYAAFERQQLDSAQRLLGEAIVEGRGSREHLATRVVGTQSRARCRSRSMIRSRPRRT